MCEVPPAGRALLDEAVRSMAQQVTTIALVTSLSHDEGGHDASSEALQRAGRAARTALAELRLVARILQHEGDRDVADPSPASLTAVTEDCLLQLQGRGVVCRWDAPADLDTLPDTVRASVSGVLRSATAAVVGTEPVPSAVDVAIARGDTTVDVDVVVAGGVDLALADALLAAVATRVRLSGGELTTAETTAETTAGIEAAWSRSWSLWVWLRY